MKRECPNKCNGKVIKYGSFFRKSDSRLIQRYRCKECYKLFSKATFSECYKQKKRRVNPLIFKLLCSGVSMRRCALILGINPTTVARKLEFLANQSRQKNESHLKGLNRIDSVQVDDLITSHHTKLKPLSISVAIETKSRKILDIQLSQIPAFGHLAKVSRKKYGHRKSDLKKSLNKLFKNLKDITTPEALFESDEHKLYQSLIQKNLPSSRHKQYKSERSSIVGQGELKKGNKDPLFKINHTLAMLRANINRLFRRTWCTTKDPKKLLMHLHLYQDFHNTILVG